MSSPLTRAEGLLQDIRRCINDLKPIEPEPGRPAVDVWGVDSIEACNASILRKGASVRDALGEAKWDAGQRDNKNEQALLLAKVQQLERDLEHLRGEHRRAAQARKMHTGRHARDRIFGGISGVGRERGGASAQAGEVKLSLQRTRKMMSEQLDRVANVAEVVGEQDAILRGTYIEHQGIGGTVKRAGTTISRLQANELIDVVAMFASTMVFFATVGFVLYQRLPLLGLM